MKEKEEDEENKIRKFAYREQTIKQRTENSNTEATLILCGSSGEWANNTYYSPKKVKMDYELPESYYVPNILFPGKR